jgi:hypothetical protein
MQSHKLSMLCLTPLLNTKFLELLGLKQQPHTTTCLISELRTKIIVLIHDHPYILLPYLHLNRHIKPKSPPQSIKKN